MEDRDVWIDGEHYTQSELDSFSDDHYYYGKSYDDDDEDSWDFVDDGDPYLSNEEAFYAFGEIIEEIGSPNLDQIIGKIIYIN